MPFEGERLIISPLPAKCDRIYKARARDSDAVYDVNLARLECSCPEWQSERAGFPAADARRVCEHIYDKLYATKVERSFDPLLQLFIRYGRRMFSYRVIRDDLGAFIVGQPFGPGVVRVIGDVQGKPILATYNVRAGEWASGETDLSADLARRLFERASAAFPEAVG
jgi:hypothetical protein